jgi:replicative DNA helicase
LAFWTRPPKPTSARGTDARVPPHSIDAEQAVLGGLMLDERAWDRIADKLEEGDFYRKDHQLIYRAIGDLSSRNKPCDAVTLGEWFESNGLADLVGGSSYVIQLANSTPSAANIMAYAEIVREKSVLRRLLDAGTQIFGSVFTPDGREAKDLIEEAESAVFAIAEHGARGKGGAVPMRTATREAFELMRQRYESPGALLGIATGYTDLDTILSGLQAGDLIIVAGRPSMGKTGLAVGFAEHAGVRLKKAVAIFSMEMSTAQLTLRMISSIGRIDAQRLRSGELEEDDWVRSTAAITALSQAPIFIDETPALTPTELRARARRLKREHDIQLIVVDYLQLMHTGNDRSENRATEVAEISRSIKALAKELKIPIVALSQLNRAVEQRTDKRPVMADLRESGGLEQDADVVMFIYRDEYYNAESSEKGIAEIIVSKQRNGPTGTVRLAFVGAHTAFRSLADSRPELP